MRTSSTPRALGVLVVGVLVTSMACGFQARKEQAEFVIGTAERVHAQGAARISWEQQVSPIEVRDPEDIQVFGFPFRVGGDLDLSSRRATVFVVGDEGPSADLPVMAFDEDVVFVRRLSEPEADRPWAKLDLSDLEEEEIDEPTVGFDALNPAVWVDLLGGALTGSVEELGPEQVGGVETTHYEANVDREKAFEDVPDDRFERLEAMFLLLGGEAIVTPAEIWIDEEGLPRRFAYELEQRIDRRNAFRLDLTFEMSAFGEPVEVTIPTKDETVEVDGLRQLLVQLGADQFAPGLGGGGDGFPGSGGGGTVPG